MPQLGRHNVYRGVHVKADFKLNRGRTGFRGIAVSAPIRKAVHNIVEFHARPIAEGHAATFTDTGTYLRSFKIDDTEVVAGPPDWLMLRAASRLYNSAKHPGDNQSYALIVEHGNGDTDGHHVFRKTIDQMVAEGIVTIESSARRAAKKLARRARRRR